MILNRIGKSLLRQDWGAVVIEFAIVVFGIYGGLQVNDWAQERDNRVQEQAALERLFIETKNGLEQIDIAVDRTLRINQMRRAAVQFADSDAPVPDNVLPLKIGINTLAQFPRLGLVSVAYDELKLTGQLQLIRSAELRDMISRFHTDVIDFEALREQFGQAGSANRFFDAYQRHVIWDYNPESTTTDILLSTYNWESLRADEHFLFEIIGLLRNQLVAEEVLVQLQGQAQALCDALGEAVGRACKSA